MIPSVTKMRCAVASALILFAAQQVQAESKFYFTSFLSTNNTDEDITAFGNNIAVDPDFTNEFDDGNGYGLGVGVGYRFNDTVRLEARLSYRSSDTDDTRIGTGERNGYDYNVQFDADITNLGIDIFYDFNQASQFSPYVKAGIGAAYTSSEASINSQRDPLFTNVLGPAGFLNDAGRYPYESNDETNFSWNVGAGFTYAITDNNYLFVEYQYLNIGDISTKSDNFTDSFGADDYAIHEINIGFNF